MANEKYMSQEDVKKVVQFILDEVVRDLKDLQDADDRGIKKIDDLINSYSFWSVDSFLDSYDPNKVLIV
ncbi:hypothetical protein [Solibacillus sp. FSL K6-1523]|uniref:hypothetical protein n=1 Tax=Solibacillus sp. FSL K6-1523 TaxID=2921471 RepID=UPI0030F7DAB6